MSDGELPEPVEFDLEPVISFNARDVARSLTPLQVVELVKQLDRETNEWEATILLASYFSGQLQAAPDELQAMDDGALEARLQEMEGEDAE